MKLKEEALRGEIEMEAQETEGGRGREGGQRGSQMSDLPVN